MNARSAGDRPFARVLGKYLSAALGGAQNKVAYASDLMGAVLSYGFFVFIFINLWGAVFAGAGTAGSGTAASGTIAGYTAATATWYFMVAELVLFATGGTFWQLAEEVKSGSVAYALTRPFGFVLYQFATQFGAALVDLLVLGLLGAAMCLVAHGPLPIAGILHVPAVLASLLLAVALNFLLQTAISLTAFWFEENSAFFWIYQKIVLVVGTLMPIEFLPDGLYAAVRWTPFPYVAWAPGRIAVAFGEGQAGEILLFQLGWVVLAAALVSFIYSRGVKHVSVQGG